MSCLEDLNDFYDLYDFSRQLGKGGIHFTGVILKNSKVIVSPGLFLCNLLV